MSIRFEVKELVDGRMITRCSTPVESVAKRSYSRRVKSSNALWINKIEILDSNDSARKMADDIEQLLTP